MTTFAPSERTQTAAPKMEKDLSPALVCVAEKMHNRELPVAGLVCAVDSHYEFAPIINGHGEQFYNACLSLCLRKADENGLDLILGAEGEDLAAFFERMYERSGREDVVVVAVLRKKSSVGANKE